MALYLELSVEEINELHERSRKVKMSINEYVRSILFKKKKEPIKKGGDNISTIHA